MLLETERLLLRPLTLADAETAFYGWTGDADVAKYVSWLPHHSIEDAVLWLKDIEWKYDDKGVFLPNDTYIWGFVLKETGELFGSGGLIWEESYGLFQVGYNIKKNVLESGLYYGGHERRPRFCREISWCEKGCRWACKGESRLSKSN